MRRPKVRAKTPAVAVGRVSKAMTSTRPTARRRTTTTRAIATRTASWMARVGRPRVVANSSSNMVATTGRQNMKSRDSTTAIRPAITATSSFVTISRLPRRYAIRSVWYPGVCEMAIRPTAMPMAQIAPISISSRSRPECATSPIRRAAITAATTAPPNGSRPAHCATPMPPSVAWAIPPARKVSRRVTTIVPTTPPETAAMSAARATMRRKSCSKTAVAKLMRLPSDGDRPGARMRRKAGPERPRSAGRRHARPATC
jgi:hypothetical protein